MTIRTRLAIWFSALVAVVLILLAVVRYSGYRKILQNQKDYSLKVIADILDSSIPRKVPTKNEIQKAVSRMLREYPDIELKGVLIEVYDSSRSVIFLSSLSDTERLPVTEEIWNRSLLNEITTTTLPAINGNASMRILSKPVFRRDKLVYVIQVGESNADIDNALENLLLLNVIFIPATTLLIGAGGWFITRRALRPLQTLADASRQVSDGDFSPRIELQESGTEISHLSAAFNQMISRLEASFRQTREFSENASHELRIPLSILRGQTELALKRPRSDEEYRATLKSNLEEILRMEKIVERLLFLSKADRGEIIPKCTEIDLSKLLTRVSDKFQIAARDKDIIIRLNVRNSALIKGDEILLYELMMNLIQNAVNHTPQNGEINIYLERKGETIQIHVTDSGCGIPKDDLPHIFERFYQVDKSRSDSGSGLGLSICKWIAEIHKGNVHAESLPGHGSHFTVSLPLEN